MSARSITDLAVDVERYLTTANTSEFFQQSVVVGEPLPGTEHLLWRATANGSPVVVKFFMDAGQARSRRQFEGQKIFAPAGLAPNPRWYDRYPVGLSRQILIYDWQPGQQACVHSDAEVQALAKSIARVHNFHIRGQSRLSPRPLNLDFFWRILEPGLNRTMATLQDEGMAEFAAIYTHLVAAATALIDSTPSSQREAMPVPIHGDFSLDNIVVDEDRPVLVDWEMFGFGDAAQEIAMFLTMQRHELANRSRLFLDTYTEQCNSEGIKERIATYERLLPLRSLDFLLHGLYSTRLDTVANIDPEESRFMFETLLATTRWSMEQLAAPGDAQDAISTLFQSWFPT